MHTRGNSSALCSLGNVDDLATQGYRSHTAAIGDRLSSLKGNVRHVLCFFAR